jgi:CRISPR/Cas system-associated protein Cas10 (large subunit of type III CRISPR-Cas system)
MKINKGLLDMLDIEMKNILQNKLMNKVNELNYDKFDESDFYDSIKIAMDEIQSGSIVKSFSSILYIFMNIITLIAVSIYY